jgi:hypothetical protein
MKFRPQVEAHLHAGLGIFDIAILMGCYPCDVRKHVKYLRNNGTLAFWWLS